MLVPSSRRVRRGEFIHTAVLSEAPFLVLSFVHLLTESPSELVRKKVMTFNMQVLPCFETPLNHDLPGLLQSLALGKIQSPQFAFSDFPIIECHVS